MSPLLIITERGEMTTSFHIQAVFSNLFQQFSKRSCTWSTLQGFFVCFVFLFGVVVVVDLY